MYFLQKEKIYNITFIFLSITIMPLAILAPLGIWLPLIISSIIYFILEEKKVIFFKVNSCLELMPFLIILYLTLSLCWTINFNHALQHLAHVCILFFAFRIVLIGSRKITIKKKVKYALFYSLMLSSLIAICDMYFNLGIKAYLLYFSDGLNNSTALSDMSIKDINLNKKQFKEGMYSGLYNRGISVITIFSFILGMVFYDKRIYLFPILFLLICLILVGESFTTKSLLFLSLFIFITVKILKSYFSFILIVTLSSYFALAPILLNLTNQEKWSISYESLNNEMKSYKHLNLGNSITTLLQGNILSPYLFFKKIKIIAHKKLLHRKMIWSFTSNQIKKKLVLGNGFSSSRKLGAENSVSFIQKEEDVSKTKYFAAIPLHPHNNTLQIWLELGLLGCVLFFLLHLFLWKKLLLRITNYSAKNIFLILSFIGVFFINQVSFGLWQTWWLASIGYFIIFANLFTKKKTN